LAYGIKHLFFAPTHVPAGSEYASSRCMSSLENLYA